jgi:hypothetical protein
VKLAAQAAKSDPSEALFFWVQAGLQSEGLVSIVDVLLKKGRPETDVILSTAAKILKEHAVQPAPGEVIRVPQFRLTSQGWEEAGGQLVVPAEYVVNPRLTRMLLIDESLGQCVFPAGDILILEKPSGDPLHALPFWNQMLFANLNPEHPENPGMARFWSKGLQIGRLRCKFHRHAKDLCGIAALGPFIDTGVEDFDIATEIPVGDWDHPLREKLPELNHDQIDNFMEETRERAPVEMRLAPGFQIIGRVLGWLRSPDSEEIKRKSDK